MKGGRLTNRNINDNDMKMDENNLYQDNENLIIVYYNSQLFINLKGWDFKVESWFGSLTEASLHQLCEGAQPQPPRLLYVCRGTQQLAHVYSVYGQTGMLDWWWSINTSQHLDVYIDIVFSHKFLKRIEFNVILPYLIFKGDVNMCKWKVMVNLV